MRKTQIDEMIQDVKDDAFILRLTYQGAGSKTSFGLSMIMSYLKGLKENATKVAEIIRVELPLHINDNREIYREMVAWRLERGI